MSRWLSSLALIAVAALSVGLAGCSKGEADTDEAISIVPKYDNILYEDLQGAVSNGAGQTIHVGTNGRGQIRRGLLAFDVASSLPRGAKIVNVRLTLNLSRASSERPGIITLHPVTTPWGEGASDAEGNEGGGADAMRQDATWLHSFYDSGVWKIPGGDFVAHPSASLSVGDLGRYTWQGEQMAADVQSWIDDPSIDFGWLLKGVETGMGTVKRFDSKDSPDVGVRPVLEIEFETPAGARE